MSGSIASDTTATGLIELAAFWIFMILGMLSWPLSKTQRPYGVAKTYVYDTTVD
jgi:hypothetical protein